MRNICKQEQFILRLTFNAGLTLTGVNYARVLVNVRTNKPDFFLSRLSTQFCVHFQGFITGLGKGIVGTVAKPTAGVLDFASGTAAAFRGQATRSSRYFPPKQARLRRNCFGPSGAIPKFTSTHAEGQEIMLKLNEGNFNEK